MAEIEDLVERWKTWELTEKEGKVVDAIDGDVFFSNEDIDLCLVTKVISSKRANCDAFRSVMRSVWRVHHNTIFVSAGNNVFFLSSLRLKWKRQGLLVQVPGHSINHL